jgi:hypothetical protein
MMAEVQSIALRLKLHINRFSTPAKNFKITGKYGGIAVPRAVLFFQFSSRNSSMHPVIINMLPIQLLIICLVLLLHFYWLENTFWLLPCKCFKNHVFTAPLAQICERVASAKHYTLIIIIKLHGCIQCDSKHTTNTHHPHHIHRTKVIIIVVKRFMFIAIHNVSSKMSKVKLRLQCKNLNHSVTVNNLITEN